MEKTAAWATTTGRTCWRVYGWAREQFGGDKIVFVTAGGLNTVALAEGGGLWVWGLGHYGQLGLGDRDNRLVTTRLGAGESTKNVVTDISINI